MTKYEQFQKKITELSLIKGEFSDVKGEWELAFTNLLDASADAESCICGQDTKVILQLKNKFTNNEIIVGNKCINHFNSEVKGVYRGIKHIMDDPYTHKPNLALINYAYSKGFISPQKRRFLRDIQKRNKLTDNQYDYLIKINDRLLYKLRFCKFLRYNKTDDRLNYLAEMVNKSSGAVFNPIVPKKFLGNKATTKY